MLVLLLILILLSVLMSISPYISRQILIIYNILLFVFVGILIFKILIFLAPVLLLGLAIYYLKLMKNGGSSSNGYYYYKSYYDNNKDNFGDNGHFTYRHYSYDEDYEILGIKSDATAEEVKKAYKKKVREYHPDFHHGKDEKSRQENEDKFKKVTQAYERLKKKYGI